VVINDFDRVRSFVFPDKTYSPLIIDSNAVLSFAVASKTFQSVAGESGQIGQCGCLVQSV
jgi:hypothetical protein